MKSPWEQTSIATCSHRRTLLSLLSSNLPDQKPSDWLTYEDNPFSEESRCLPPLGIFAFAAVCAEAAAVVMNNVFAKSCVLIGLAVSLHTAVSSNGAQALDATQVRLLPGSPFYERQELHCHGYLASFEPDRLLFHYRALAGLPQPEGARAYGGWDSGFIRGHMAGHYLSAASRMAAATGDKQFRERVNYMVGELAKCQDALKQDGYLAAFPLGAFDRLEGKNGNSAGVVVPYYTIHKIMAGLLDAHHYLGNTHNMLKLTARLFERNPSAEYADYAERALYDHLLATVAPDTGPVTYFTPLRGTFRTYLTGNQCCVGTGIENTPRYNESIYFQQADSLWVNLYIPSELDWRQAGLIVRQEGDLTRGGPVRFTVVKAGAQSVQVHFRIPHWISKPAAVTLNGKVEEPAGKPSTYVSLRQNWKAGDVVTLTLPASLRLEQARDDSSMVSIFFGPVLLAGELGRENMPNDSGDPDANMKTPAVPVPDITASSRNPADWLQPIPDAKLAFRAHDAGPADGITFRPLYDVHHERYSAYWRLGETSIKATP